MVFVGNPSNPHLFFAKSKRLKHRFPIFRHRPYSIGLHQHLMLIFFDTNIFYKHWQARNADFNLLFDFVSTSKSTLLVSNLVCEEMDNGHNRELKAIIDKMKSELAKAQNFNPVKVEYDFEKLSQPYSFKKMLEERLGSKRIKYIPYGDIPQAEVVTRAINVIRPFQEEDKGYRDTLIWLSLLQYIKLKRIRREVIFLNNNKNDFFNVADGKVDFHPALKKDIKVIVKSAKIIPYDSLGAFITDKIIVSEANKITGEQLYEEYLNSKDREIEFESSLFIERLSSEEFKEVLSHNERLSLPYLNTINMQRLIIDEGVEDPEVISFKQISKELIYVKYKYNLRKCTLYYTIPLPDYQAIQHQIDRGLDVVASGKEGVTLRAFLRTYLDVSFNYNLSDDGIEGFSIEDIQFRAKN